MRTLWKRLLTKRALYGRGEEAGCGRTNNPAIASPLPPQSSQEEEEEEESCSSGGLSPIFGCQGRAVPSTGQQKEQSNREQKRKKPAGKEGGKRWSLFDVFLKTWEGREGKLRGKKKKRRREEEETREREKHE